MTLSAMTVTPSGKTQRGMARAVAALESPPTQVRHPWREAVRNVLVAGLASVPIGVQIIQDSELDSVPWIASTLALIAAVSRVIHTPEAESFLARYVPGLAAGIYRRRNKDHPHAVTVHELIKRHRDETS